MSNEKVGKYVTKFDPVQGMEVIYNASKGIFIVGDMFLETVIVFDQDDYKFYTFNVDGKLIPVHIKYDKGTRTYTLVDIESPIYRGIADASGPIVSKYVYLNDDDKKNTLQQLLFILDIWVKVSKNHLVNNIKL
jgi:hypothetical protein